MHRRIFAGLAAIMLALLTGAPRAHADSFGLGIIVGEPTGISSKLWLGPNTALDAAVAWSTVGDGELNLQADYVWHAFNLFDVSEGSLPLYYGIGGRLKLASDHDRVGVRVPVGLAYMFENRRFDIFGEVAPTLDLNPSTDFSVSGGIGVRYFLK